MLISADAVSLQTRAGHMHSGRSRGGGAAPTSATAASSLQWRLGLVPVPGMFYQQQQGPTLPVSG